jgi:hypothetical protein
VDLAQRKKRPKASGRLFLFRNLGQQSREARFNLPGYEVYGR